VLVNLLLDACADGQTYHHALDHTRLSSQRAAIWAHMADGRWRTLGEIASETDHPEASVSARLRDFRKARFGGHAVERRRRGPGTWEYRVLPAHGQLGLL